MTTTIHAAANGRKRPSLSDQINRLDQTLDGLADGLNEAVADAVKDAVGHAVREAVQAVLTEVLTNPQLVARLHAAMSPLANASESTQVSAPCSRAPIPVHQRLSALFAHACASIAWLRMTSHARMRRAWSSISNGWQRTLMRVTALSARWQMLRPFKYQILMAMSIGILVGVLVLHAGPGLGAVVSGIGGFVTTLTVQAGLWLRKMFASDIDQLA
jgi:hypothetical protein